MLENKIDPLTDADVGTAAGDTEMPERGVLRLILYDALASEAMGTLTTGVFLVGFAIALGAGKRLCCVKEVGIP